MWRRVGALSKQPGRAGWWNTYQTSVWETN